ncbi:MAG: long-chain fatty acid transport protein outer membrane protein [Bacteroidota bacterium]
MKKLLFSILTLALFSPLCYSGGFQINLQGQKQTGMGHTGVGLLSDATTIHFNAGALSFLKNKYSFSLGSSLIFPRVTYLEPAPGNYTEETVHNIGTPISFYFAGKVNKVEGLSLGIGVYNPYGSKQQWPDNWIGQFLIREIDLKTFFVQPTASYKINEKLGVGAGFIYAFGSFGLKKGIPAQDLSEEYGDGNLSGKASGVGYNAAIYFQLDSTWSFGLTYRSAVKTSVENGTAQFNVASSLLQYFPTTTFSTQLELPQVISFGAGWTKNKLRLALDINYVGWKSYDSLVIDFADNTEKLEDIQSPRNYENSFIFRIGSEYTCKNKYVFRLGMYYDMTPVQDGYLTPETPDVDKLGITSGFSYHINEKINLDISFLFIEGKKRYDQNFETQFAGTYKSRAFIPGFGLSIFL